MRKEQFEVEQFYHIFNRGVEKRDIFTSDRDRVRFIRAIHILNNFLDIPSNFDLIAMEPQELLTPIQPRVKIVAGCLMPSHFHLMCSPLEKDGLSKLLHKVCISHATYFNKRYERTGRLFDGPFKARHVDRHEYASYLTQYIHLNPAELFYSDSNVDRLKNTEEYPWSSLQDYLGKNSQLSPILSSDDFRAEIMGMSPGEYHSTFIELYRDKFPSNG